MSSLRFLVAALSIAAILPASARAEMIHLMARNGDVDAVKKLIADGVPVDLPSTKNTTEDGVSPLFIAAKFGRTEVVRALLDEGADHTIMFQWGENAYYYGTPLHIAARWGHVDIVNLLLDAGSDPGRYNSFIGTPLHLARLAGHEEIAERLVAAGAPVRLEQPSIAKLLPSANVENGREIARGCEFCHLMSPDGAFLTEKGPSLWDVVDRPTGSQEGYDYSPAMAALDMRWTYEALNSYIASPYQFVPGTSKILVGLDDAATRADLIAYLRTLSNEPVPLP